MVLRGFTCGERSIDKFICDRALKPADGADKTVATVLGEIVWLMSQDPAHKHHTIADLEWLVMPPILLRQFKLFYKEGRPVAVVLYARASKAVAARLAAGGARLDPAEWRSGERVVVVRTIAPFGAGLEFAAEVQRPIASQE